jgi:hypothetical protein
MIDEMDCNLRFCIVARTWRQYKTGFELTTGFIGLHYSTLNYSVYTLQLTT